MCLPLHLSIAPFFVQHVCAEIQLFIFHDCRNKTKQERAAAALGFFNLRRAAACAFNGYWGVKIKI